ncbi:hypothetical protein C8Q80DRAFT_141844 [Daedaleopsis nitida]|nr:hypothetical protein C8Q80DRAFT_141844 [Daedaleopsis nitida]
MRAATVTWAIAYYKPECSSIIALLPFPFSLYISHHVSSGLLWRRPAAAVLPTSRTGRILPPTASSCLWWRVPAAVRPARLQPAQPAVPAPTSSSDSCCATREEQRRRRLHGVSSGCMFVLLR